jgi:chemotaxis methyl-accepting protein methylase
MLAPHWLDDVFQTPEKATTELAASDRFKEAVAKAQAAYYEAEEIRKKNPKVVGSTPAQQARVAFLEMMNAN